MKQCLLILVILTCGLWSPCVSADALFPLASLRFQKGFDCWAYGPAQMLEARLESREGASIALDIEKDAYYYLIHDRLLNSYMRKKISSGVLQVGAYAADYLHILKVHGADTFKVNAHPSPPNFEFPYRVGFQIETQDWKNVVSLEIMKAPALERELVTEDISLDQAEKKIDDFLQTAFHLAEPESDQTPWISGNILKTQVLNEMAGDERKGPDFLDGENFILVSAKEIRRRPQLNGHWLRYDDDRFWAVGQSDVSEILRIARLSMDRGWPVTLESPSHAMTGLGYHTIVGPDGHVSYSYGVVDQDGTIFLPAGFAWHSEETLKRIITDITVFYPAVQDALPPIAAAPAYSKFLN